MPGGKASSIVPESMSGSPSWPGAQRHGWACVTTTSNPAGSPFKTDPRPPSNWPSNVPATSGPFGPAVAYKIGQLKISELRERAARELGPKFDLRDFNDAVLETGSVPLQALERHIDAGIAARKG